MAPIIWKDTPSNSYIMKQVIQNSALQMKFIKEVHGSFVSASSSPQAELDWAGRNHSWIPVEEVLGFQ